MRGEKRVKIVETDTTNGKAESVGTGLTLAHKPDIELAEAVHPLVVLDTPVVGKSAYLIPGFMFPEIISMSIAFAMAVIGRSAYFVPGTVGKTETKHLNPEM